MSMVWSDRDGVWIGQVPACPAGAAHLAVRGGVLIVDPLDPGQPALSLSDPTAAQETVTALYGLDAWDSVAAVLADPTSSAGEIRSGWALGDACRLAVVGWLAEFSPDPLDDDLLALEAAVLGDRLSTLLGSPPGWQPAFQIAAGLIDIALDGHRVGPPEATSLAVDLLTALADRAEEEPDDEEGTDLLDLAADAQALLDRWYRRAVEIPTAEEAGWHQRSVLTPVAAGLPMDDGEAAPEPVWRTCGTDWDLVPRGAFDPSEDAIRWRLHGFPGLAATLEMRIRPGWAPAGRFLARWHAPGASDPLVTLPLSLTGDGWVGQGPAPSELALVGLDLDDCWADVTSANRPRPARLGPAQIAAAGRRWSMRAATRLRFALASGALLDSSQPLTEAIGSLERARMQYARLGSDEPTQARRRHYELGVALHDALTIRGEPHETDDLAAELSGEAHDLGNSVDGLPHPGGGILEGPNWRLTVAERAMLIPS